MHTMQCPSNDMEAEADAFAQEFLMPRQYIKHQLLNPTFSKLAGLKTYWKVSMQALIMRAASLGLISPRQKAYLFTQLSRAGYRLREPPERDPPTERPTAIVSLVAHHIRDLGYSASQMAASLDLLEPEFRASYLPSAPALQLVK